MVPSGNRFLNSWGYDHRTGTRGFNAPLRRSNAASCPPLSCCGLRMRGFAAAAGLIADLMALTGAGPWTLLMGYILVLCGRQILKRRRGPVLPSPRRRMLLHPDAMPPQTPAPSGAPIQPRVDGLHIPCEACIAAVHGSRYPRCGEVSPAPPIGRLCCLAGAWSTRARSARLRARESNCGLCLHGLPPLP